MDRALYAAATGMAAQQQNLDTIANNLANLEVAGFKSSSRTFSVLAAPGESGLGTVSTGEHLTFTQGKLDRSNGPFDMAIDGSGFFVLTDGKRRAYTRDGEFSRAADGALRNATGWRLAGVRIPEDAIRAKVATDGAVSVTDATGKTRTIAHLKLAMFPSPERLNAVDGTVFLPTPDSGDAKLVALGADGGPNIRFGMLEQSNVSIVESMMQLLAAQRAYEANAKGVQAADEMLRIANNLQRG